MIQNLFNVIGKNYSSINTKRYFIARYSFKEHVSNLLYQKSSLLFTFALYVGRKRVTGIAIFELFENGMDF